MAEPLAHHPAGLTSRAISTRPIRIPMAAASVPRPVGLTASVKSTPPTPTRMEGTSVPQRAATTFWVITTRPIPMLMDTLSDRPPRQPTLGVRLPPRLGMPTAEPSAPARPTTGDGKTKEETQVVPKKIQ